MPMPAAWNASEPIARAIKLLASLVLLLALIAPLSAQTPTPVAPATDEGMYYNPSRAPIHSEQDLLNELGVTAMPSEALRGQVYIPDEKLGVLVQPQGRAWRDFRTYINPWIHAGLIALALIAVILLAILRGSQDYQRDPDGRRVARFRPVDRFVHWSMAVSFIVLALTGLNIVFGRWLIQPLIGDIAFGQMTLWGMIIHNSVGYVFIVAIFAMAVMWLQDNLFNRVDWYWFRRGGGLVSGEHIPAEKFNAGQKLIYWFALIGGLALGITGILMMLPIGQIGVNALQWMHGIHSVVAALMIAMIIGHIYLGSFGVQGSFEAMSRGDVDYEWARTHHPLWVGRILGARRRRDRSSPQPGE
jgi:formate dehydrogenase subunit gamma